MTESAPKKKPKKKGPSPTRLSLDECERRGWFADVVEQRIPHTFITRDLFGIIDIVAITPSGILGIQATSGSNHASRVNKAMAEPRLAAWIKAGGRFAVWSWDKDGHLREEEASIKKPEAAHTHVFLDAGNGARCTACGLAWPAKGEAA